MKTVSEKIDIENVDKPVVLIGITEKGLEDPMLKEGPHDLTKLIKDVIELGDFKGKSDDLVFVYTLGKIKAKRILLVGLGEEDKITVESIRRSMGDASRKARDLGVEKIAISLDHFVRNKLDAKEVTEGLTQGIIMGSFQNLAYRTIDLDKYKHLKKLVIFSDKIDEKIIEAGIKSGKIIADAVNFSRELSWGPANYITPTKLAEEAERIAKDHGIKTTIFDREKSKEVGLHSFIAVAQGTEEPPKFIIMEYGADLKDVDTIALIGKAITFDTGGISLKPGTDMLEMKADMSGGAVVIAAMEAIAQLKPNVHIVAIVPATDNMPSGKAYHPGDIISSYSGQTIEVISTDAEGRMVINDGLTYAAKNYQPKYMFDFATLTGSMWVALGGHAIGYFANDDKIAKILETASKTSGEKIWRMPLWKEYDVQLKSDVADFKHTGGRGGGAITAARFLSKFVMDVPWIHMDIAGTSGQKSDKGYNPKGSRGVAVRLIVDVIRNYKK
ncbi:MAG: leucyl aminopeptidase [Candidatus Heimdallarchaeota archaeon]